MEKRALIRMSAQKFWRAFVIHLMAGACLVSLALGACAPTARPDDETIRQGIEQAIERLRLIDQQGIANELGSERALLFEELGLDGAAFVQLFSERLSYSIEDIEVEGERASVELSVTNVDFAATADILEEKAKAWFASEEAQRLAADEGELGVIRKMFLLIEETLKADDAPLSSRHETVAMVKDEEGLWHVSDEQAFARALLGDSAVFSEQLDW